MKLILQNDTTTAELSDQFHSYFPFLKIEFFKSSHEANEPSKKKELIKENLLLSDLSGKRKTGEYDFSPRTTVAEFEKSLHDDFGLNVQVFRQSGTVWLVTTVTDNLTLQSQNALGREKMDAAEQPDVSDIDYD